MLRKLDESLLSDMPPFSRLAPSAIREILDRAASHRFDDGTTIFHEGHAAERFYIALDGIVRVSCITPEGEQVIVLHIPPGQLFGIARALGRTTYPATAMAATEMVALSWPTSLWSEFAGRYEGFATETYASVGQRMGAMREALKEIATQQVEQRIANALLRLTHQTGRKVDGGIEIGVPLTRQDLSEMTGTTLYTVSRLLSTWERDGIIESRRKHIRVTDPHRLLLKSVPAQG